MDVDTINLSSEDSSDGDNKIWLPDLKGGIEIEGITPESYEYLEECRSSPCDSSSDKTTQKSKTTRQVKSRKTKNEGISVKKKITVAKSKALKNKISEEKQAMKNANKIYKPGECVKHMTVEIHPVLLDSWFCADVQREINLCGAHLKSSTAIFDPKLVLWSRTVPPTLTNDCGMVKLTPSTQSCNHGLYIHTAEDIEGLISTHQLSKYVKHTKLLAGCDLTLVVFGIKDYFKSTGRKTANSRPNLMTDIDLEKAMTDLLVSVKCDTILVNTPNELALTIAQFTKSIAEEPHKKAKRELDDQAVFYMRGDNKKCVTVDKDGNGLSSLWQQMLAVLPLSSLETSRALCAEYKTPLALYQELESNGSTRLADVGVSRTAVPGSKPRRLGPEFARKLCKLFTSEDGTDIID